MGLNQKMLDSLQAGSSIRKMFEEGEKRSKLYGAEQVFDFSLGNPVFEPPKEVHQAIAQVLTEDKKGLHRYMPNAGLPEVRRFLAAQLKKETGLDFRQTDLIMTVGAGGGLNVALKALLNPGEEVIVFSPYFVEYDAYIQNHGGIPIQVPTQIDFHLDLAALERAISKKTKALIINSPNNPTGVVYSKEELAALGELLRHKAQTFGSGITLLSDEPYRRIAYVDEVPSILAAYPNSVIVTSYSKDLALPGERIGYLAISPQHAERELLFQVASVALRILGFVNAPAIWQRVLPLVGNAMVDLTPYRQNRDALVRGLRAAGYEVTQPEGAFYLFPKSPNPDDAAFVAEAQAENLLLVPGRAFARPGYFRIAYCVEPKKVQGALPLFARLMARYQTARPQP